jgi:hypothetical protein
MYHKVLLAFLLIVAPASVLGQKLVRPPPLPIALQGHGVEAYSLHNDIWVEFNHREFFQSLTMQMTATA